MSAYRAAGYDFLVLTDHFEARWGWRVTDTAWARDASFTTLPGAELSSADWDDESVFWVNAIGLPPDFAAPAAGEPHDALIARAAQAGAYVVLLHPGLTHFLDFDRLPTAHLHAVETYNVNAAHSWPDQAEGATPSTRCSPAATRRVLLHPGPGDPRGRRRRRTRAVTCSPARAIALTGIHGWRSDVAEGDPLLQEATLDLGRLRSPYWRLTVTAEDGRRAWTNPVWR